MNRLKKHLKKEEERFLALAAKEYESKRLKAIADRKALTAIKGVVRPGRGINPLAFVCETAQKIRVTAEGIFEY